MSYFCNGCGSRGSERFGIDTKAKSVCLSFVCCDTLKVQTLQDFWSSWSVPSYINIGWLVFCNTNSLCDTVWATHDCLVCEKQLQSCTDKNKNYDYIYRTIVLFDPYRSSLPAAFAYCRGSASTAFSSVCCSCGIWRRCWLMVWSFGSNNRVTTSR